MNLAKVQFTDGTRRMRWRNAVGRTRGLFAVAVRGGYALQLSGDAMRTRRWFVKYEVQARSHLRSIVGQWGGRWTKFHDTGSWDALGGEWPGAFGVSGSAL